jgi:signal peptidase II
VIPQWPQFPGEQVFRKTNRGRDVIFIAAALFIFVFDQTTKALVRNNIPYGGAWPSDDWLVKIVHGTNSGAAFGILQGQGTFLVFTAILAMVAILLFYRNSSTTNRLVPLALGMQLGGAFGNLSDRLRFGEVTDLISFPHYPAFNFADSSIVVSLVLLTLYFVLYEVKENATHPS